MRALFLIPLFTTVGLLVVWVFSPASPPLDRPQDPYRQAAEADFPEEILLRKVLVEPATLGRMYWGASKGGLTLEMVENTGYDLACRNGHPRDWVDKFVSGYNESQEGEPIKRPGCKDRLLGTLLER